MKAKGHPLYGKGICPVCCRTVGGDVPANQRRVIRLMVHGPLGARCSGSRRQVYTRVPPAKHVRGVRVTCHHPLAGLFRMNQQVQCRQCYRWVWIDRPLGAALTAGGKAAWQGKEHKKALRTVRFLLSTRGRQGHPL